LGRASEQNGGGSKVRAQSGIFREQRVLSRARASTQKTTYLISGEAEKGSERRSALYGEKEGEGR